MASVLADIDSVTADASAGMLWYAGGTIAVSLTATGVGVGTSTPATDLDVSGSDGVVLPSGTLTSAPAARAGALRYMSDATGVKVWVHDGAAWAPLGLSGTGDVEYDVLADSPLSGGSFDLTGLGSYQHVEVVLFDVTFAAQDTELRASFFSGGTQITSVNASMYMFDSTGNYGYGAFNTGWAYLNSFDWRSPDATQPQFHRFFFRNRNVGGWYDEEPHGWWYMTGKSRNDAYWFAGHGFVWLNTTLTVDRITFYRAGSGSGDFTAGHIWAIGQKFL